MKKALIRLLIILQVFSNVYADVLIAPVILAPTIVGGTSTATALALAGTPATCSTGYYATGINATGSAVGCAVAAGGGTVLNVSGVNANGFAFSITTSSITPTITLSATPSGVLKSDGTVLSVATPNADYVPVVMSTIGDTVYGGAVGVATKLAGNTTSTQKFLSITGDGTNSAAPSWETVPIGGLLTYFFRATSDVGVAADFAQTSTEPTAISSIVHTNVANASEVIGSWITASGIPSILQIPAGQFNAMIHAYATSSRVVQISADIWETNAAGSAVNNATTGGRIAILGTTAAISSTQAEYILTGTSVNVTNLASTASRILTIVYAVITGAGTLGTTTVQVGGASDSHTSLPSPSIDASSFLPYVGATAEVNLGTHGLSTASGVSATLFATPTLNVLSTGTTALWSPYSITASKTLPVSAVSSTTLDNYGQTASAVIATLPLAASSVGANFIYSTASGVAATMRFAPTVGDYVYFDANAASNVAVTSANPQTTGDAVAFSVIKVYQGGVAAWAWLVKTVRGTAWTLGN